MRLLLNRKTANKVKKRTKLKVKIRKKVSGTPERPRLCVFKSGRHTYAQIVDDISSKTLVSCSTNGKSVSLKSKSSIDAAKWVGEQIAKKSMEKDIKSIVFDRSGYVYHGRVKAVADAAREAGLQF